MTSPPSPGPSPSVPSADTGEAVDPADPPLARGGTRPRDGLPPLPWAHSARPTWATTAPWPVSSP